MKTVDMILIYESINKDIIFLGIRKLIMLTKL